MESCVDMHAQHRERGRERERFCLGRRRWALVKWLDYDDDDDDDDENYYFHYDHQHFLKHSLSFLICYVFCFVLGGLG